MARLKWVRSHTTGPPRSAPWLPLESPLELLALLVLLALLLVPLELLALLVLLAQLLVVPRSAPWLSLVGFQKPPCVWGVCHPGLLWDKQGRRCGHTSCNRRNACPRR